MIKYYKGQHIIHLTDAVLAQNAKAKSKKRLTINPQHIRWKP